MNDQDNKKTPTDEELEALLKQIKELKEENKKNKRKRPKGIFMIEFGGVYHPNIIINFIFSMIINNTLAYLVITVFDFATYDKLYDYILFIVGYTFLEWIVREYITRKHLQWIVKSFGMVLYFSYIFIVYILDRYVFVGNFTFNEGILMVAFVTVFLVIRYIIGTSIKQYFRKQIVR